MNIAKQLVDLDCGIVVKKGLYIKMIIVFNGPPGSGKDVGCDFLKKMGFKHIEFKSKLFKDTIRFYKVDEKWFYDGYTRDTKDVTEEKLSGLSRRQALINVSENVRKRLDGDEFYGKIAADGMVLGSDYCISDGGFTEEIGEVINKFGKDEIIFVRLFRDGYDYASDSRRYIRYANEVKEYVCDHTSDISLHESYFFDDIIDVDGYVVHNNGSLEDLHTSIEDIIRTYNDRKNTKQTVQKANF